MTSPCCGCSASSTARCAAPCGGRRSPIAAVGLVVGVPAGVIAGRRIWSALAEAVGVVDDWSFPWLTVVLAVTAAMAVAVLLAIPPGRAAAHMSPGQVLRSE